MRLLLFRRLALAALVCLTVLVVSFTLTRLSGDLAASIAGPNASANDIAIITRNYGLDRPLVVQFFEWARPRGRGGPGCILPLSRAVRGTDPRPAAGYADAWPDRPCDRAADRAAA